LLFDAFLPIASMRPARLPYFDFTASAIFWRRRSWLFDAVLRRAASRSVSSSERASVGASAFASASFEPCEVAFTRACG
jgi:hypothetical protein